MPMFRSAYHGTYTVSGEPVVTDDLASAITGGVAGLLAGALIVMGVVLLLVFRNRPRLLPLGIALAAAGITFGVVSLVGGSLTMASIAVLPILIGLAVDYAIQFQARASEARSEADVGNPIALCREHRRADDRDRRARHRRRIPRAAALAGPDGPRVRRAADRGDRDRARVRAHRGLGGARAEPAESAAATRAGVRDAGASPARAWRDRRVRARRAGDPRRREGSGRALVARGWGRTSRGGRGGPPAGSGAARRIGPRRCRLGRGHADARPIGRDQARALQHAGVARPAHARARHGRLRRDRRGRALEQRRDAEDDRVDAALRGRAARSFRISGDEGVCEGDAVPGAVAAGPVLLGCPGGRLVRQFAEHRSDLEPAEGGAAVLLAGGDHARSSRGDARVRDSADAAVATAAGDRLHARAAASPARGRRGARRPARARGAGGRVAVLIGAADADAAGGAGRGRARAARGPAHGAAGDHPARADRARDRLVVADPVRDADPAQPDVGHARRARDRDLHGVQRAAVRTVPAGAKQRARRPRRRSRGRTGSPDPRCSRPGSPRSPGSAC